MILPYLSFGLSNFIHRKKSGNIYLSFGENCLTDHLLGRYLLKSFTTPFSHCRSNIEYILDLERNNYENFVPEFLEYGDLNGKPVPRLKTLSHLENNYHHLHMNGIEFSNHDVIRNQKYWRRILAQVKNLKSFLGKRKYVLLYHHRVCEGNNPDLLLRHLSELKTFYSAGEFECEIVLYRQTIIPRELKKELIYQKKNEIHVFDFHSYHSWSGRDQRKYWAYTDDSLIRKMLKIVKTF